MKKLLKSKICDFINSARCALFTGKVKHFYSKRKKKKQLKCKRAFGKRKTRFPNAHEVCV